MEPGGRLVVLRRRSEQRGRTAGRSGAAARCIFTVLAAVSLTPALARGPSDSPPEVEQEIERVEITAMRFRFAPARIRVAPGKQLEIVLSSRDVEHGFEIVGTETEVRIPERGGGSVTVTFEAEEKGRYLFRCSHKCGAGHEDMRGVIVVR